ncbi:hypothetical protein N7463_001540 [Penicillium fimorum]|uniref:Uncharacterized protein n=1 Tax=Penicillium fimorum TaxID=1882269 RepID=A0A9W9Y6A9_9EURO|nr:hypothetical protein N7463_001540 [Penicillium fimorum]
MDILYAEVAVSDIVFHTATVDHLLSVQAIIDGIRYRAAQGLKTIYIHNSGATLLSDSAQGDYKSDGILDDEQPGQIDTLPDSASHRSIDLAILQAGQELVPNAKMAIMIPPLIYGSLKHGYPGQMGKDLTVWN